MLGPSGPARVSGAAPQLRAGGVPAALPPGNITLEEPGGRPIDFSRANAALEGEAQGALMAGQAWGRAFDSIGQELEAIARRDRQAHDVSRRVELDGELHKIYSDFLQQLPADPEQWLDGWEGHREPALKQYYVDQNWNKRDQRKARHLVDQWRKETEYDLGLRRSEQQRLNTKVRFDVSTQEKLDQGDIEGARSVVQSQLHVGDIDVDEANRQYQVIARKERDQLVAKAIHRDVFQAESMVDTMERDLERYEARDTDASIEEDGSEEGATDPLASRDQIDRYRGWIALNKAEQELREVQDFNRWLEADPSTREERATVQEIIKSSSFLSADAKDRLSRRALGEGENPVDVIALSEAITQLSSDLVNNPVVQTRLQAQIHQMGESRDALLDELAARTEPGSSRTGSAQADEFLLFGNQMISQIIDAQLVELVTQGLEDEDDLLHLGAQLKLESRRRYRDWLSRHGDNLTSEAARGYLHDQVRVPTVTAKTVEEWERGLSNPLAAESLPASVLGESLSLPPAIVSGFEYQPTSRQVRKVHAPRATRPQTRTPLKDHGTGTP